MSSGLEDVVAATSSITYIDGARGRLLYRGYDIDDLARHSSYEETCFLLWHGRLPTSAELLEFSTSLAAKRALPRGVSRLLEKMPRGANTMDSLRAGVACLGIFDDPSYSLQEKAASIASKVGTIVAQIHVLRNGGPSSVRPPRSELSFASNFLYMLSGAEPDKRRVRVMDEILILHADHELNASTFAARVVASTLSDPYSAVTAAVGALKGPLHGGANEKVMDMVREIGKPGNVERYVRDRLAAHQKIMGFGHRVYKAEDPRARILRELAGELASTSKETTEFETLLKLQEVMLREKNIHANVDLFSGLVLNMTGVPNHLFTPVFAVGRTPGWLAHILEQQSNNRIMRPVAEYTGPTQEPYVSVEKRAPIPTSTQPTLK